MNTTKAENQPKLLNILVKQINTMGRVREDFGDMVELIKSIRSFGILQPIAVKLSTTQDDAKELSFDLLDGGRRLKAILSILNNMQEGDEKFLTIPALIFDSEMSELQQRKIEHEANEQRKAFTFAERATSVKAIHDLMVDLHGAASKSKASDAGGWRLEDTALKIGRSKAYVSLQLKLAEGIEIMPELADSKNESEARTKLRQAEATIARELLLEDVKQERSTTPVAKQKLELEKCFIVQDAREGVKEIPSNSIDLVEIDWPFSVGLDDTGNREQYIEIPPERYMADYVVPCLAQAQRILKPTGWILVWYGSEPWAEPIYLEIAKHRFRCRRIPYIWASGKSGECKRPEYYAANGYETCYYGGNIDATMVRKGQSNVLTQPPVPSQLKIHRTQKPVTLYEDLISRHIMPRSSAISMFAGSGNFFLACSNLGVSAKGWDLSEEHHRGYLANVHKGTPGAYAGWQT